MWNSWNPGSQLANSGPVDWAAKAAEWALQQAAQIAPSQPPPPPPPDGKFQDTVENDTEMEDVMPTNLGQANEWSAVTDPALEQYNSSAWQEGGAGAQYQSGGGGGGFEYPPGEIYGGYHDNQFFGAEAAYSESAFPEGAVQDEYSSQGYPGPFPKQVESGFPERGLPPPPTHTLPIGRGTFRDQPALHQPLHSLESAQLGAAEIQRRKALPAWIRDGLNKMEKSKHKDTPVTELANRPRATVVTGYDKQSGRGNTSAIHRNKISGYSALQESGASSDEKEEDPVESDNEVAPKMDPVLFVKRALTEILLGGTGSELRVVVMECLQQEKAIKQLDELCKKKATNGPAGLDLVSYNDQSSSDSSSSSDTSSNNDSKDREQIKQTPSQPEISLKLESNKENDSAKGKVNSSPKLTKSRRDSEVKSSKLDTDSNKASEKSKDDGKHKSANQKAKSSKKSSRHEKNHDPKTKNERKKSRDESPEKERKNSRSGKSDNNNEQNNTKGKKSSHSRSCSESEGEKEVERSRKSKQEKGKPKRSIDKVNSKDDQTQKKKTKKKSSKEIEKIDKVKELNKRIEKATRQVEKKTKQSRKRLERSSSSSSSASSTSSEDHKSSKKKKKRKSKSSKKKKEGSSTSSDDKKKEHSSDSSSDYGYKYSSSSSDRKHKTRKR